MGFTLDTILLKEGTDAIVESIINDLGIVGQVEIVTPYWNNQRPASLRGISEIKGGMDELASILDALYPFFAPDCILEIRWGGGEWMPLSGIRISPDGSGWENLKPAWLTQDGDIVEEIIAWVGDI